MNYTDFILRLTICFVLSLLIGIERQLRNKRIGLRTNVLVCIGSFLFVYLSFGAGSGDNTRIAAQVVSGIGFLGAGVILREGDKIRGLNTAATLWCNAAIGALSAAGLIVEAIVGTSFVLFSNIILRYISLAIMNRINEKRSKQYVLNITCRRQKNDKIRASIIDLLRQNSLGLESFEVVEITEKDIKIKAMFLTILDINIENIINEISTYPGIISVNYEEKQDVKTDNETIEDEE